MSSKNRLLLFANDPASANVTSAYAYLFKDSYDEILAFAFDDVAKKIYLEYIPEFISEENTNFQTSDTVVTGTSGINPSYEMNAIVNAKKVNVSKTITIVDNTVHFNSRFLLNNNILPKEYLPDEIWLFEKNYICSIDYFNEKIVYKEDIYDLFLKHFLQENPPIIKNSFVQKFQNNYLVILTEYVYDFYGLEFGFTEYEMLECILEEINKLNINIPIFLKLHPKEHTNKFNILLRKYSHLNIYQGNCNIQELIYYSKIVFGINSTVFKECLLFHKPTFSIQIDAKKTNKSPLIEEKRTILHKEKLELILKQYF